MKYVTGDFLTILIFENNNREWISLNTKKVVNEKLIKLQCNASEWWIAVSKYENVFFILKHWITTTSIYFCMLCIKNKI